MNILRETNKIDTNTKNDDSSSDFSSTSRSSKDDLNETSNTNNNSSHISNDNPQIQNNTTSNNNDNDVDLPSHIILLDNGNYYCSICYMIFTSINGAVGHKTFHQSIFALTMDDELFDNDDFHFQCKLCPEIHDTKQSICSHVQVAHRKIPTDNDIKICKKYPHNVNSEYNAKIRGEKIDLNYETSVVDNTKWTVIEPNSNSSSNNNNNSNDSMSKQTLENSKKLTPIRRKRHEMDEGDNITIINPKRMKTNDFVNKNKNKNKIIYHTTNDNTTNNITTNNTTTSNSNNVTTDNSTNNTTTNNNNTSNSNNSNNNNTTHNSYTPMNFDFGLKRNKNIKL